MDFFVTNRKIAPNDNTMRLTVQRDTMTEIAVISFNRSDLAYFYQSGITRAYAVYKPHGKAVQAPKMCSIDETDTDRIVVTWEIDDTATQAEGVTEFQIIFSENDPTDDEIVSIWATLIYNLSVPRSLLAEDVSPEEPTPLIIEQMLQLANQAQDAADSVSDAVQIIEDNREIIENIDTYAEQISADVEEAQQIKSDIDTTAVQVAADAQTASTAATNAGASETAAAGSATAAAQSAADAEYYADKCDTYTKSEIDAKIAAIDPLPAGGTVGQHLAKAQSGAEWVTPIDAYTKTEVDTLIGGIDPLPAGGTVGQVITKTATGADWETPIDAYTKSEIDAKETAVNTAIGTKITAPATGAPGQYLMKTESGVEWADVEGGGGTLIVQPPVVDVTTYTYDGTEKSITFSSIESNNVDLTGDKATNAGTYTCTVSLNKQNAVWSDTFTTTPKTFTWTINKAAGALTLSKSSVVLDPDHLTDTVTCTVVGDGTLTVTSSGTDVATATLSGNTITIASVDDKSGNITVTVSLSETTNYSAPEDEIISVKGDFVSIYGAEWDGTSTTAWTRTDEAAPFIDPVPAINNGNGSSPFDDLMPWSGMVIEERTGGTMVKIPKFYYKITRNGNKMKIQIADGEADGFEISPAHMDRGDGNGERDAVYIGRYHCGTGYKSITSVKPLANMTRSSARTNIHNLGAKYWQMDFATRFTIWLLYIVEFADWNTQAKIGYGCGNNSATENMGYTDSMTYHTGTKLSSRTTYGLGTQYRYIEGLWDNVYDWCDGCYYNSNGLNIILNPSNFNDSSNGTLVGKPSNGYPSAFASNNTAGFTLFYPTAASGSESTYSCDYWGYDSSYPCLFVGGYYNQYAYLGLFYVNYSSASNSDGSIGCRLLELP